MANTAHKGLTNSSNETKRNVHKRNRKDINKNVQDNKYETLFTKHRRGYSFLFL